MKKYFCLIIIGFLNANANADMVKDTVGGLTKGIVKFTKEVSGGVSEGIKEGRSSTESADGTVVVTNEEETLKYIEIDVVNVSQMEESDSTVVEFSFKNNHNKPIKITGLGQESVMIAIDKDGYSHALKDKNNIEITVANEAAKKYSLSFSGANPKIKQVRVWHKTYDVISKYK